MIISVDISYYPLKEKYIEPIAGFIQSINHNNPDLVIRTSSMSTQVIGDFDKVMDAIKCEIAKAFLIPKSVFVLKIINIDLTDIPTHE